MQSSARHGTADKINRTKFERETMKEARSSIQLASLQESLDAEDSAKWATLQSLNQYFTPPELSDKFNARLPIKHPASILDPQVGKGGLVEWGNQYGPQRYGIDIDNRIDLPRVNVITGNCVKVMEAIDDLYPDLTFAVINANPPFAKRWKDKDEKVIDSTLFTWEWVIRHGKCGYFISNYKTIERFGIHKHPFVYHYEKHENVWKDCEVVIGVVFWENKDEDLHITPVYNTGGLIDSWKKVAEVVKQEAGGVPEHNIFLDEKGMLRTYLSVRHETKRRITRDQILRLTRINKCHPLALTTERESRDLMNELINCGLYTIQPEAKKAIEEALLSVHKLACPLMPPSDFELVAFADDCEVLTCRADFNEGGMAFSEGVRYKLTTGTYKFTEKFTRQKVHFSEQYQETYTAKHDCTLTGQDRYIQVTDDNHRIFRFMSKPKEGDKMERDEALLWRIFQKPVVKTIMDAMASEIEHNKRVLKTCELLAGYQYYPGQFDYIARMGVKDNGLIAAAVGTGKTLCAISLIAMKAPNRALIVAPQGTMRSSESEDDDDDGEAEQTASQWIQEINRFAPYVQVFELFSYADYERILSLNNGKLPNGIYVSYFEAMFQNGARETAALSWDDEKLFKYMEVNYGCSMRDMEKPDEEEKDYWCKTVGKEVSGIRCIIEPCLSTRIGGNFDMVLIDEAHKAVNMNANLTQMLIRLQPRYRYALTATPIPNIVSNLFSLMGWLSVPLWFKGDRRNAAFPYAREELPRFNDTFLSEERDHTEEARKQEADPHWRGKCVKTSPVISSPARLLKILKPTMGFISKADCNPDYRPGELIEVRVPLGKQQAKLYGYYLDRGHIPAKSPLVRARKQIQWLRAICADPAHFTHGAGDPKRPRVSSNMNPKTVAILELVREILARGEQVNIIGARIGQTNTIQHLLTEAGVSVARIDSTISAQEHARQSNLFKAGKAQVLFMGIKCAMGYSFSDCPNQVIGSLEYSYGSLEQARGRVDRVNSKRPPKIYCILHKGSIEETQFDVVATKEDAARICLMGQRIPRNFKPVDAGEILAMSINNFNGNDAVDEEICEAKWPSLLQAIRKCV